MKKLVIICITVAVLLVGCTKKADTKPILNDISFNTDITYYNESYKAFCSIREAGNLSLELKESSEVEGMIYIINEDGVSISYKGLTYTPSSSGLLSSACTMLYDAFSAALSDSASYEIGKQNCSVSAKTQNGEFIMQFSPSGLPLDLKYVSGIFNAEFSDVTLTKNE